MRLATNSIHINESNNRSINARGEPRLRLRKRKPAGWYILNGCAVSFRRSLFWLGLVWFGLVSALLFFLSSFFLFDFPICVCVFNILGHHRGRKVHLSISLEQVSPQFFPRRPYHLFIFSSLSGITVILFPLLSTASVRRFVATSSDFGWVS